MKVGILGMGPSMKEAPFYDTSWEWWGMPWSEQAYNMDRWFDIHDWGVVKQWMGNFPSYLQRLQEADCPVIMQEKHDDIPRSEAYPLERATREVGDYFGSSIAYMASLAILEEVEEIGLWGVDLRDNFDHERPNIEFLIGFAAGRGIKVTLPERTVLKSRRLVNNYGDNKVVYPVRYGWV